jgi:hypothetical protein
MTYANLVGDMVGPYREIAEGWFARRLSRPVIIHRKNTESSVRGLRGARPVIQATTMLRGSRNDTWRRNRAAALRVTPRAYQ